MANLTQLFYPSSSVRESGSSCPCSPWCRVRRRPDWVCSSRESSVWQRQHKQVFPHHCLRNWSAPCRIRWPAVFRSCSQKRGQQSAAATSFSTGLMWKPQLTQLFPCGSRTSGSAPILSKNLTIASCSFSMASIRGYLPSGEHAILVRSKLLGFTPVIKYKLHTVNWVSEVPDIFQSVVRENVSALASDRDMDHPPEGMQFDL